MASRTPLERLEQNPADSARYITEGGEIVNLANEALLGQYSEPAKLAFMGKMYFANDTTAVPADGSVTYTIQTPADKYVVQFARDLKVTGNIWDIDVLIGGTVTGGVAANLQNSKLDVVTPAESSLLVGTTVTGFTLGATDFIAAPGQNKSGGLSGTAGGTIVIYPPNGEFSVRATNTGNTQQRIHLDYLFTEVTADELARLRDIYVV